MVFCVSLCSEVGGILGLSLVRTNGTVTKSMGSGFRESWIQISAFFLCILSASFLDSLNQGFLICKMGSSQGFG